MPLRKPRLGHEIEYDVPLPRPKPHRDRCIYPSDDDFRAMRLHGSIKVLHADTRVLGRIAATATGHKFKFEIRREADGARIWRVM